MRITKTVRAKITKALLENAFADRERLIEKRKKELALALYRCRVTEKLERQADKLNKAAAEADIPSLIGTNSRLVVKSKGIKSLNLSLSHARPWGKSWASIEVIVDEGHEQFDACCKLRDDLSALAGEKQNAEQQIKATLAAVNTEKQLGEIWPESLPIAQPFLRSGTTSNTPAIPTKKLNAILGLGAESTS